MSDTGGVFVAAGDLDGDGAQFAMGDGSVRMVRSGASDGNVIYVGTANGGVWKTTNGGQSAPTPGANQIIAVLIGL
jgi:hypothetical protein